MVHSSQDVRPSPLAGTWYPAQVQTLTAMLDQFLKSAQAQQPDGQVLGLLAPHAGYRYSGPVAAHAFAQVKDMSFDSVVVIGPLHHPLDGRVLTTTHTAYETPLGQIPVDHDTLAALGKQVTLTPIQRDPEHSVEIELPFLQHLLKPGFSLVPLMLRDQSKAQTDDLAASLSEVLKDRKVLLVASSDLSHFYPQQIAHQLDGRMLSCIEMLDHESVIQSNEARTAFACGYGAIATVIKIAQAWQGNYARIVNYATSGDITGDLSRVVGYGAAMFCHSNAESDSTHVR